MILVRSLDATECATTKDDLNNKDFSALLMVKGDAAVCGRTKQLNPR